jgi:hypothetical protein
MEEKRTWRGRRRGTPPPWNSHRNQRQGLCVSPGASPCGGEDFCGLSWRDWLVMTQESLTETIPMSRIRHDYGWIPTPRRSPVNFPPMGSPSSPISVAHVWFGRGILVRRTRFSGVGATVTGMRPTVLGCCVQARRKKKPPAPSIMG